MEVVRHRTSGKVLSHRHILRVTDDDDCWSLDVRGLPTPGSLWVSAGHHQWSLLISGDRREEGETDTDWGQNTPELRPGEDQNRLLGLGTGGWGGHQWLA